jgi:hypothetical protein
MKKLLSILEKIQMFFCVIRFEVNLCSFECNPRLNGGLINRYQALADSCV